MVRLNLRTSLLRVIQESKPGPQEATPESPAVQNGFSPTTDPQVCDQPLVNRRPEALRKRGTCLAEEQAVFRAGIGQATRH